jgi:hypothetical protein
MRRLSQNVNHNVYETGLAFGKIDPLRQARMRQVWIETVRISPIWNRRANPSLRRVSFMKNNMREICVSLCDVRCATHNTHGL